MSLSLKDEFNFLTVLHHYGFTIGLWQADMGPYGGVLQVKVISRNLFVI